MKNLNFAAIMGFLIGGLFIIGGIVWNEPLAIWWASPIMVILLIAHLNNDKWVILTAWHYSIHWPGIWFGQNFISYQLTFTESCRYDLGTDDQQDWNKLFGVGFGLNHHKNSVRFGWRYNPVTCLIEIASYWYRDGERGSLQLVPVPIGSANIFSISIQPGDKVVFMQNGKPLDIIRMTTTKSPGFRLHPYFGGNRKAPHKITILKEKFA